MKEYELVTFQKPGHDITLQHDPLPIYGELYGPYWDLKEYLKLDHWLWTFQFLSDYQNPYFISNYLENATSTLWHIRIPAKEVQWCGLLRQCDNETPVDEWFFDDPDTCRDKGDIPQGLIRMPISSKWIINTTENRQADLVRLVDEYKTIFSGGK